MLTLAMLTGLMPAAWAADSSSPAYDLGVGTIKQLENDTYCKCGEDSVTEGMGNDYDLYYDSAAKTLQLNSAAVPATLRVPGGTTIEVTGGNTINGTTGIQVTTDGDLTVTGDGKLGITSNSEGIVIPNGVTGNIEINGSVELTLNTDRQAVRTGSGIIIGGNAVLNAKTTGKNASFSSGSGTITASNGGSAAGAAMS